MMRLPFEIVRLIVEEVEDTKSLVALSRASKQLQMEAERRLYRSLTEENGTKSFKCLSIVKKSPRRAGYVRAYHVHTTVHKQRRSMWNLIKRTLPLMVNLKELVFRHYIGGEPWMNIFPAKYTHHLEKFVWLVTHGNPNQEPKGPKYRCYVAEALKFLEGQTQLQLLHWQPSPETEPYPKPCPDAFFPKLDTLIGDIETIRTYLPGRDSITTLQWFTGLGTRCLPFHTTLEQIFERLSPQLKGIKYLSIQPLRGNSNLDFSCLHPIIPHLHSLETLWIPSLSELEIVSNFFN
jgi:hypothetical protein